MTVGTRTLLIGVHQFLLHPFFVWIGWLRLYGWTWDPRVLLAILIHDWGYWGSPNLDGWRGKHHPTAAANWMRRFGREWRLFTGAHSRWWADAYGIRPSRLCYADKMAILTTPKWLYLLQARLGGEFAEYAEDEQANPRLWLEQVRARTHQWVMAHYTETT